VTAAASARARLPARQARTAHEQAGGAGQRQQEGQYSPADGAQRRHPAGILHQPDRQRRRVSQGQRRGQQGGHGDGRAQQHGGRDGQRVQPGGHVCGYDPGPQQDDRQAHRNAVHAQQGKGELQRFGGRQHRGQGGEGDQADDGRAQHEHGDLGGAAQARGQLRHGVAGEADPKPDVRVNHR